MTNKQKYKQAFSVLHTSGEGCMEVGKMADFQKKQKFHKIAVAAVVCIGIVGGSGAAYAADVCGIQRTIQLWIHGDQTNATLEIKTDGTYQLNYQDENGNLQERGGGGVAFGDDGTQRALTASELMEELSMPEVEYREDGTVWLYYYDQELELTDQFENGICYVTLKGPEKTLYVTVRYQNGYSVSERKYIQPDEA